MWRCVAARPEGVNGPIIAGTFDSATKLCARSRVPDLDGQGPRATRRHLAGPTNLPEGPCLVARLATNGNSFRVSCGSGRASGAVDQEQRSACQGVPGRSTAARRQRAGCRPRPEGPRARVPMAGEAALLYRDADAPPGAPPDAASRDRGGSRSPARHPTHAGFTAAWKLPPRAAEASFAGARAAMRTSRRAS